MNWIVCTPRQKCSQQGGLDTFGVKYASLFTKLPIQLEARVLAEECHSHVLTGLAIILQHFLLPHLTKYVLR